MVAGIFHACGCWVGETNIAPARGYDTYENHSMISWLQRYEKWSEDASVDFNTLAPDLRSYLTSLYSPDLPVVFKYFWGYGNIMKQAFPEGNEFFVWRNPHSRWTNSDKAPRVTRYKKMLREVPQENIIDSDKIIRQDFSQIKEIIESQGLVWDEQKVMDLIKEPVNNRREFKTKLTRSHHEESR